MQITVTHEDLLKGIINSPTSDPVALAAQRAGLLNPIVGRHRISVKHGTGRAYGDLSPALKAFRQELTYGDRYEILDVVRNKKGEPTGHKPATFDITFSSSQELKAAA